MPVTSQGRVTPQKIVEAASLVGTPFYLYDEQHVIDRCRSVRTMPHAFGLYAGYAMKANSSRALLQIIAQAGLGIDASSLNEARRALAAGIAPDRIMLTTQEVPNGAEREALEQLIGAGMKYNACSLLQLELVAEFAHRSRATLALRVNPGAGAGESVTRNTGDKYSSFGIHLDHLPRAIELAKARGVRIDGVHVHIGSGGDPESWRANIDRMLEITGRYFPEARVLNLGGGFKEARMPEEQAADIQALGAYAKQQFVAHAARTGQQLAMGVEPGTYIVANGGYLVTSVIDKKSSGPDGFEFVILDGGMESSTRPLLYGSRHPFDVVSRSGELLSSEHDRASALPARVVCGKCCESGDSQTLDAQGHIVPRPMADPAVGDHVVVGGAGAYVSAMTLVGYNSHPQAPEVLLRPDGTLRVIRQRQTLAQLCENELGIDP